MHFLFAFAELNSFKSARRLIGRDKTVPLQSALGMMFEP
jgi:hypothetical protein